MTRASDYESRALAALRQAVAEALERKRRLGQYAVIWRDGRALCIGPDAPPESTQYAGAQGCAPDGVAEPTDRS